MFPKVEDMSLDSLCELDKQILYELNKIIEMANEEYSKMDFFLTTNELRNFVWNKFASHYIELVKQRAYNSEGMFTDKEQESAWYTLHKVLRNILLILHPVAPFITDYIWRNLYNNRNIVLEKFPEPMDISIDKPLFKEIMTFNSIIWKNKKDKGYSLKDPVELVITSTVLKAFEKDLIAAHNIQRIRFEGDIGVDATAVYFSS